MCGDTSRFTAGTLLETAEQRMQKESTNNILPLINQTLP